MRLEVPDIPACWKLVSVLYCFSAVYFVSLLLALTGVKTVAVSYQFNTCSVANDPRPQMIPKPEMIPKLDPQTIPDVDRKWQELHGCTHIEHTPILSYPYISLYGYVLSIDGYVCYHEVLTPQRHDLAEKRGRAWSLFS